MNEPKTKRPVVYIISCAAPPVLRLDTAIQLAQSIGFNPCIVLTPTARSWIDVSQLVDLTGYPVRSEYKLPGEPDVLPSADALVVAPATFNTINKWAIGITDNLALGVISEGIGKNLPIICVPFTNQALSKHYVFKENVKRLSENGVEILLDDTTISPTKPDSGFAMADSFPWDAALKRAWDLLRPHGLITSASSAEN